jgi:hypothetical protein
MQWNSIAGVVRHTEKRGRWPRRYEFGWETSEWSGTPPEQGNVRPDLLVELLDVLAVFTRTTATASTHSGRAGDGCTRAPGVC